MKSDCCFRKLNDYGKSFNLSATSEYMTEKLEKVGYGVLVAFIVLAVISFILPRIDAMYIPLYGTDPEIIGYSRPSSQHILGTDFMGRDLFSQLCAGAYFAVLEGMVWSIVGIPVLVAAAYILSQLRSETPHLEDTPITRYCRFVAFPLGVIGFISVLTMLFASSLGHFAWMNTLFFFPFIGFVSWLAVGHDMEERFRKGGNIPRKLYFSGMFLIFSSTVIYDVVLGFLGLGDPSVVTWGMMLQWCFVSGYTFKAVMNWLLPPILCIYVFSRGMLALSYGLYNAVSKKYFFREGWF